MTAADREIIRTHGPFVWSVADLLRGDYRRAEYGRVILPLVVLRRLDCVLDRSKDKVLRVAERVCRPRSIDPLLRKRLR